jgi:ABC-type multidrug transport system fused ATPase/permease subunit
MLFRQTLSAAKSLLTPAIAARGALFSALVLFERLLIPAAAWSLFREGLAAQIALAFGAAAVFSGRAYVQQAFRAKTEVDLLVRVASRLMGGDVLRANVLRDEDARAELGQGMYHAAHDVAVILPQLLADALAAASLACVIIAKEPVRLVAILCATALFAGALLFATRRPLERVLEAAWAAQHECFTEFMDALEGRLEVVASGRRVAFLAQMRTRAAGWGRASARVASGALVLGKLPLLSIAAIVAVAIGLASSRGQGTLGVTTADIALLAGMTPAFTGIAQDVFTLARTERWMGVVARALSEPPLAVGGKHAPPQPLQPIVFDRVSFSYQGAKSPALRDVSFAWSGERILALTGPNGSGKSTCLRLLLGLAHPQSGVVRVGGIPVPDLDADEWRRSVAFLPQRPYLPPRSDVRAAVRFLVPGATDDGMREAIDRVGLSSALKRFGGDPLAVRVAALSVGERQRVGVARLLCQKASLVLLDEPDANLDRADIALMANLVRELARAKLVAFVAHNADLLAVADRVLALEEGLLVDDAACVHRARSAIDRR